MIFFFFSSRRRHTRFDCDWSSDVCSSDLHDGLGDDLLQRRQPLVLPVDGLEIVVPETHRTESEYCEDRQPDVVIGQIGPEERRNDDREEDQDAPHGRRAALDLVPAGAVLADPLANAVALQRADHRRPEHDGECKGGERGVDEPEAEVAEDVEDRELRVKGIEQEVQHYANSSSTHSIRVPREPLSSTTSPARRMFLRRSARAPCSCVTITRSTGIPAPRAPAAISAARSPTVRR